jgi:P-loop Domain of unknown function (DUF2791)
VIRLEPLNQEHLLQLLQRLTEVHKTHYAYEPRLGTSELQQILRVIADRMGADAFLTPGEIVRDFMGVLNVLHQNPKMSLDQLLKTEPAKVEKPGKSGNIKAEFAEFTL